MTIHGGEWVVNLADTAVLSMQRCVLISMGNSERPVDFVQAAAGCQLRKYVVGEDEQLNSSHTFSVASLESCLMPNFGLMTTPCLPTEYTQALTEGFFCSEDSSTWQQEHLRLSCTLT